MFRLERGPILVTTLAIALARSAFGEVEFVTDSHGAKIAETMGWRFDGVNTALDRLELPGCSHVWAAGKLEALRIQERPCVQFDGDVLLLSEELPAELLAAPLIAQSPDIPAFYLGRDMERAFAISGLPRGFSPYNAGLIGGADVSLVQDYAAEGLDLVRKFAGTEHQVNGTTISMLCEQYHLGRFAAQRGVKVGALLPMHPTVEEVKRAGYAHLVGSHKRNPFYVAKVEARLATYFPMIYARALDGLKELLTTSPTPASPWCAAL
ncbi:DUF6734 family protein [Verrucomicrobiota bacterium sgz303538]